MPKTRYPELAPAAAAFRLAPRDPARQLALVETIVNAVLAGQRTARPGEIRQPRKAAARLIEHHVAKDQRAGVRVRVTETLRARQAAQPPTAAEQVATLPTPDIIELLACGVEELRRRDASPMP